MGRMRQRALKIRKHERSLANHRSHDEYQSDERGSEYAYEDDDLQASFLKKLCRRTGAENVK